MPTVTEITMTMQDGVVKAVETSQRLTLEAMTAAAKSVDKITPKLPKMPFADKVTTPTEAIDMSFSFAERLMEAQKTFLEKMVAINATPAPTPIKK